VPLLYADYAASGRSLRQIERFIEERILPFYANAHTEASYCGAFINRTRDEARCAIARICNADDRHAVIFTGSGATSGVNRLTHLLFPDAPDHTCARPLILLGPYEHHSNLLPWRESGAEIVEIAEDTKGGPDLALIAAVLDKVEAGRQVIGAFSAVSNVTGIVSDVPTVTALLKQKQSLAIWDYAAGAPYVPIDMDVGGGIDAIVFSPHKFVGGPGASGLLIVRRDAVVAERPSFPGGGTVSFVSPWDHHYSSELIAREEAGTPNVIGDIRAALVLMIKERIGEEKIAEREAELAKRAMYEWSKNPRLEILGRTDVERIPIFSFRVKDSRGGYVHQQLVTRILSDYYGVQARGGCACAGPYAHRLLGIEHEQSDILWQRLSAGHELEKPGWTRVNFSCLMDEQEVEGLIDAVSDVARVAEDLSAEYGCDRKTARFRHKAAEQFS
jgi:selenocysteine lyase/cysteine desulfurase